MWYNIIEGDKVKKTIILSVMVIVSLFIITGCGKNPGTITISISTENGIIDRKLKDDNIVDIQKSEVSKKNTFTDKKTGKTSIQEIVEVRYELTAKKTGNTTLTVKYKDYKTNEEKTDIFNIEVDKYLNVKANKE